MIKDKRYLITTADEKTWKFDCPVVFLGEWCRRFNRKKKWLGLNAAVAKPYGLDLLKRDNDYSLSLQVEKNIFSELRILLNKEHGEHYSERFWSIVLGHWLKSFIRETIKDINTIKGCIENYEISGTTTYNYEKYQITPNDYNESLHSNNFEIWKKNILYIKILKYLNADNFPINIIHTKEINKSFEYGSRASIAEAKSFKKRILRFSYEAYSYLARKFIRDDDAYILNTYLPTKDEIKLELSFGQFPQLWKFQSVNFLKTKFNNKLPDQNKRDKLSGLINKNNTNIIEKIIRKLLFELLPINYLENFSDIIKFSKQQIWPKSPKFIFTSNNFYQDDIFKIWSALKVENGSKLFLGQHGNNYGTLKYKDPRVEELTADKFISWGWQSKKNSKIIPGFIFKTAGTYKLPYNSKGGLLLIEQGYTKNDCTYDSKFDFLSYLQSQKEFVSNLDENIRKQLTIRLFNENYRNEKEWAELSRWKNFDYNLKLDNGVQNIRKLIFKNRLIVHSYDSTGLLETLSLNIPTIAFWKNELNHLLVEAKPYYKLLYDAGIIHFSPKSTADKIRNVWNNVDEWWTNTSVQNARNLFCEQYAKTSKKPVSDLKQILLS